MEGKGAQACMLGCEGSCVNAQDIQKTDPSGLWRET